MRAFRTTNIPMSHVIEHAHICMHTNIHPHVPGKHFVKLVFSFTKKLKKLCGNSGSICHIPIVFQVANALAEQPSQKNQEISVYFKSQTKVYRSNAVQPSQSVFPLRAALLAKHHRVLQALGCRCKIWQIPIALLASLVAAV